jgi:hypothetical protein
MAAAEQSQAALQFPWQMFFRYVYAAKFLCGEFKPTGREGPVQPGRYSTAINVHNPHGFAVAIRKKAILLFNGEHPEEAVERPVPPTHGERTVIKELGPDWGLEIDCLDIRDLLLRDTSGKPGPQPPIFIKGRLHSRTTRPRNRRWAVDLDRDRPRSRHTHVPTRFLGFGSDMTN